MAEKYNYFEYFVKEKVHMQDVMCDVWWKLLYFWAMFFFVGSWFNESREDHK